MSRNGPRKPRLATLAAALGAAFATSLAAELFGLVALGPVWELLLLVPAVACFVAMGRPRLRALVSPARLGAMAISVIVVAASVYDQNPMRMMALFSPGVMADFSSGAYHPCDPVDAVAWALSGDLAAHAAFPGVGIHALRCRSADVGDQVYEVVRVGPVTVPGHATRLILDEVLLSDGFVFVPDFRLSPLVDAAAARRALERLDQLPHLAALLGNGPRTCHVLPGLPGRPPDEAFTPNHAPGWPLAACVRGPHAGSPPALPRFAPAGRPRVASPVVVQGRCLGSLDAAGNTVIPGHRDLFLFGHGADPRHRVPGATTLCSVVRTGARPGG